MTPVIYQFQRSRVGDLWELPQRQWVACGWWDPAGPDPPPEALVCPKSAPPVRRLCAFRMEELTSFGWDMRLTLSCLQGLVNRSKPRLYLVHDYYDECSGWIGCASVVTWTK